jgi:shikimate kinase
MGKITILLVGPKHAGKTSVARALAAALQCRHTDLDALIEARTGKNARTLYKEGVEAFRKAEAEALRLSLEEAQQPRTAPYTVISTGGGMIDNGDAVAYIESLKRVKDTKDAGNAVIMAFLDVSALTAWSRIREGAEGGGELPPFLQTETPRETHRLLHERRNRAYREFADFTIQAERKTAESIAAEILRLLFSNNFIMLKP